MQVVTTILLIITFFAIDANAQTNILKKAVEKINGYENISYHQIVKQKSPFADDTTTLTLKSSVSKRMINGKSVELFTVDDRRGFTNIYNGSTHYSLDLNNNTFSINKGTESSNRSPYYWGAFIETYQEKFSDKIAILADTVINDIPCYHFKFPLVLKNPEFKIYDIYIDKETYMPIQVKEFLQGRFGKGAFTSKEIASIVNVNIYSHYDFSLEGIPDISSLTIPVNFKPENTIALLSHGEKQPRWNLTDALGVSYSSDDLKGKATLIEFTFNSCAACILAIPILKRLNEKYKGKSLQIININTLDSKESVLKFVNKHNLQFPVLLNGKAIGKSFQVSAYPTFYLIDQEGNIVYSAHGYNDDLEQRLIHQIDFLL